MSDSTYWLVRHVEWEGRFLDKHGQWALRRFASRHVDYEVAVHEAEVFGGTAVPVVEVDPARIARLERIERAAREYVDALHYETVSAALARLRAALRAALAEGDGKEASRG